MGSAARVYARFLENRKPRQTVEPRCDRTGDFRQSTPTQTHEREVSTQVQRYLDKPRIFDERLGVWVVGLRTSEPTDPWAGLKGHRTFELRDRRNMPMRRVHARSPEQVLDRAYQHGIDVGCVVEVKHDRH